MSRGLLRSLSHLPIIYEKIWHVGKQELARPDIGIANRAYFRFLKDENSDVEAELDLIIDENASAAAKLDHDLSKDLQQGSLLEEDMLPEDDTNEAGNSTGKGQKKKPVVSFFHNPKAKIPLAIVCNPKRIAAYSRVEDDVLEFALSELSQNFDFFLPIDTSQPVQPLSVSGHTDIKACKKLTRIISLLAMCSSPFNK